MQTIVGPKTTSRVHDFTSFEEIFIDKDQSLAQAAADLSDYEVGALVVTRGPKAVGLLSERDVIRAVSDGVDLNSTLVEAYMTWGMVEIDSEATMDEAVAQMDGAEIRHLVVTRGANDVGILSARDCLRWMTGR